MNGVITGRIFTLLPRIAALTAGRQLVLNLSVDGIGELDDSIRGALRQLREAKGRSRPHPRSQNDLFSHRPGRSYGDIPLQRGADCRSRARGSLDFRPDSYIAEVAEKRVELRTLDKDITPASVDYRRAVAHLRGAIQAHRSGHPVARLVESLRLEYYELSARILEQQKQVIDCYAGWASGHLSPDGHVWGCCVRAESLGNVRDSGYDFGRCGVVARRNCFGAAFERTNARAR